MRARPRRFLSQAGTLWLTRRKPRTPRSPSTRYRNIYISVVAPASVAWPIHVADDAERAASASSATRS